MFGPVTEAARHKAKAERLEAALRRIERFPAGYPDEARENEKMAVNSVNQAEIASAALLGREPWDGAQAADPLPAEDR
jgi:hypothetical protein